MVGRFCLDGILLTPLKHLYFDGPTVMGIGFWEKLPSKDICSHITGVSATFWEHGDAFDECHTLVSRKFDTFVVGVCAVLYVWSLYRAISYILFHVFVLRPITNEIKSEITKTLHILQNEKHVD